MTKSPAVFETTSDQLIITRQGMNTIQYLIDNHSSRELIDDFGLMIDDVGEHTPFFIAPNHLRVLPCSRDSKVFAHREGKVTFELCPISELEPKSMTEPAKEIFYAMASPKRMFFASNDEFNYEDMMQTVENSLFDPNSTRLSETEQRNNIRTDDLVLEMDTPQNMWHIGNFMAGHGVDVMFHPSLLLLFLGKRRGACFAKALMDGARFNIADYMGRLYEKGIYLPQRPMVQADVDKVVKTGMLKEPPIPHLEEVLMGALPANGKKIQMYRLTGRGRITFPWLTV